MRKRALHHMWIHSGAKGQRHASGPTTKKPRHKAFEVCVHIDSMCKNMTGDGINQFVVKSLDEILTAKDPREFKKLVLAPDQASENESMAGYLRHKLVLFEKHPDGNHQGWNDASSCLMDCVLWTHMILASICYSLHYRPVLDNGHWLALQRATMAQYFSSQTPLTCPLFQDN